MEQRIKCTYAVVYDSNEKPLYSLQRADFGDVPVAVAIEGGTETYAAVELTEAAKERIKATSDVQVPKVVYMKRCAIADVPAPVVMTPTPRKANKWLTGAVIGGLVFWIIKK